MAGVSCGGTGFDNDRIFGRGSQSAVFGSRRRAESFRLLKSD